MKIIETNLQFNRTHTPRKSTEYLVIHHGASSKTETAESYHRMHQNRGWYGIGYHYIIEWDGTIKRGRPENVIGAHSVPVNSNSIGICLVGDFTKHEPSKAQLNSLVWLVKDILTRYPKLKIVRHKDTDATACPGHLFPWGEFLKGVNKVTYQKFNDLPDWAKPTIKKLMDRKSIAGDTQGNINLSEEMVRILVILDREGVLK